MIILEPYTASDSTRWNEFVHQSKNGIFLFDRSFMDYHKSRFSDASLIFSYKNKIIAILPANAEGNKIYSHQGLTFGSLLLSNKISIAQVEEVFLEMIRHYANLGFDEIIYKKIPFIFSKYPSEEDLYALFRIDATLYRRDVSSVISIQNALRFSETKRQNVKRCNQESCTVTEERDFGSFWNLLEKTLLKFDVRPIHSLEEIIYLQSQFPEKIKCFCVRQDGEILAGTVVFDFGETIHTQYMAASKEGKKLGALDYLIHYLIQEEGLDKKYLSFGISTEEEGRMLNEGLIQQKEMLGGRAIVLDHYKIDLRRFKLND